MNTLTVTELRDFRAFLRACSDAQVQGVYDKEWLAGRFAEAELAVCEADARGLALNTYDVEFTS